MKRTLHPITTYRVICAYLPTVDSHMITIRANYLGNELMMI